MRCRDALAKTKTSSSLVGMNPEQASACEHPLEPVRREIRPVAVGHRPEVPARTRVGGAGVLGDRGLDAVRADHERCVHLPRDAVRSDRMHATDPVLLHDQPGDREVVAHYGAGLFGGAQQQRLEHLGAGAYSASTPFDGLSVMTATSSP